MQIPDEVLDLGLKPSEFYLLAVLYRRANYAGVVELTMESLSDLTGSSRTTIWRDMTGLENKGLLDTHRTKRNFGKFYKNKYQLLTPCFKSETWEVEIQESVVSPCFKSETSTASKVTISNTSNILVKNTSYSLGGVAPIEAFKEIEVVNSWSDDDDIAGFGLLDSEVFEKQKPKKVNKARPVNRMLRPEVSWSAQDVATEFGMMLYQHCKAHTGPLDSNSLRTILSTYRKRYNLTSTSELEVLRMMFADENALTQIRKSPERGYKIYLSWLINYVNQTANGTKEVALDTKKRSEYVYASDGTEFDNSMSGRIDLAQYEATLKK
jgi:hypothetical protein